MSDEGEVPGEDGRDSGVSAEHSQNSVASPAELDAIEAFWAWWRARSDEFAETVNDGRSGELGALVSMYVDSLGAGLSWEMGPGKASQHHLALSSAGNPELRVLTERWLSRAPKPDEHWEYYAAKQRSPGLPIGVGIGGLRISFDEMRLGLTEDQTRQRVDLKAFHPQLFELDEKSRGIALYVFLDHLLGEDGVERWLGLVEVVEEEPGEALDPAAAREALDGFAASATSEKWSILEVKFEGPGRHLLTANLGLKRVDHLLFDVHYSIALTYPCRRPDGMPDKHVNEELWEADDALAKLLGPYAVKVAHETKQGVRTIHLHAPASGAVLSRIEEWAEAYPQWSPEVSANHDPGWKWFLSW